MSKKAEITFSKFTNTLIRNEKKPLIQQSMRKKKKKKLRKVGLCFITGCLINPFKMIIIFFIVFIYQAHLPHNLGFLIPGISKGEIGNGK